MSRGLFGDLFDFDRDGELNFMESAMEFEFLKELEREERKRNGYEDDEDDDY